eukprot:jgi/Picre1/27135/NNA_000105.t1
MVIQHPSARQGSSPTSTAVSGGTNLKHGRASRYRYISIVTSLLIAVMVVMAFSPFFHGNLVSSSAAVHEIAPVMMTPSPIRQAMIPLSSPEGDETSLMTVRGMTMMTGSCKVKEGIGTKKAHCAMSSKTYREAEEILLQDGR